jgi:hypothetical protein
MSYDRRHYEANREKYAAKARRWRYGDNVERLWQEQGGRCANPGCLADLGPYFEVDHDHRCCSGEKTCGRCLRGLLCRTCNNTLRQDMTEARLRGLADYLNAHPLKPRDQMEFSL